MAIQPCCLGLSENKMKFDWWRLLRFGISGALAAGVYFLVMTALLGRGLHPMLSGVLSYTAAMPLSFAMHKLFTFKSKEPYVAEVPRFVLASAFGVSIASGMPTILLHLTKAAPELVVACTCIATPCITYVLLSTWVFNGRHHA